MMGTLLVVFMTLAALAFVAYPLVRGIRGRQVPPMPDLETQMVYADAEEIELDFRTGKLDGAEYEALTQRVAAGADDELEKRIKALRKDRKQKARPSARAGGQCAKCGTPYDPGDRFCVKCGANLAQPRACANCGAPYESGDRFCVKCGKPL
jgi:hypothetical protein